MSDILLVHGSCHGAWCWRDLEPALEALGHSARSIDMPGHGADPTPVGAVTLDSCAQAVVDGLRENTVVLAHSWGGFPATRAADLAPGRIARLIYLCAYAPWDGYSLANMRRDLGLNEPAVTRYFSWLGGVLQGDLGTSLATDRPVADMIGSRIWNTLRLALLAAAISVPLSLALGLWAAMRAGGAVDKTMAMTTLALIAVPEFFIGLVLMKIFAVELGWLPSFGRGETVKFGNWSTGFLTGSGLKARVLPSITLGLYQMTLIMRLVRSEMLEVLRQDYIRFARARGLRERAVNFRHALKNTLVPVITVTGLQLGSIIAFAIITETVFQWPGVGLLFINAIQFVDIPVMAAYLMLISVMFVSINLVVDLLYFAIDPRLRADRTGAQ